jgi:single-strand DNA-binding protein
MLCKNRITLIGFVGQEAETRITPNGNQYTHFSVATSVSRKENGNGEYKTRTKWHRVICWNKLADWAGNLHKGAYVEVEGELRYREYAPAESDHSIRVAEIYATSILALDRSAGQSSFVSADSDPADEPVE